MATLLHPVPNIWHFFGLTKSSSMTFFKMEKGTIRDHFIIHRASADKQMPQERIGGKRKGNEKEGH
jgi:hypothetical protein